MNRMFLVTLHLKTNLTERALGELFGVGNAECAECATAQSRAQNRVNRVLQTYIPYMAALFTPVDDKRFLYVIDGTLIPTHDRSKSAKSKNYRRSIAVQVLVRQKDRRVIDVSEPVKGSCNDIRAWKESDLPTKHKGKNMIGDGGYRGATDIKTPVRDKQGRIIWDKDYKKFRRKRATVEHVLARLKDYQVLRQLRKRGRNVDNTIKAVLMLYNLNLGNLYVKA